MSSNHADVALGDFLRSRRDAFEPDRLTFPSSGRRRVPGLRREELAMLAGVSVSYYTRVEQGAVSASASVLDAIARALDLSDEDRGHLHRLARARHAASEPEGAEQLEGSLDLVLRTVDTTPVGVLGREMNLLGWNQLAHLVFADHLPLDAPWSGTVNWAELLFLDPACRARFLDWDEVALDLVGRLRASAARRPDDHRIATLVADLTARSEDFARLWAAHPVRVRPLGGVRVAHPRFGELALRDTVLRAAENDEQLLLMFHADPGSDTDRTLRSMRAALRSGG